MTVVESIEVSNENDDEERKREIIIVSYRIVSCVVNGEKRVDAVRERHRCANRRAERQKGA